MKLLADECLEPEVVAALLELGHDVLWMRGKHAGTLDLEVSVIACNEGRVVLSYDVGFASEIRLSQRPHPGFVIARLSGMPKFEIAQQFAKVLQAKVDWNNRIAVQNIFIT